VDHAGDPVWRDLGLHRKTSRLGIFLGFAPADN
jgi:hypothetical protein